MVEQSSLGFVLAQTMYAIGRQRSYVAWLDGAGQVTIRQYRALDCEVALLSTPPACVCFFNTKRFLHVMVQGFIIDRTYRLVDGKPKVYLFGRLETGESFLSISDYLPYFYFRTADREAAEKLVNFIEVKDSD